MDDVALVHQAQPDASCDRGRDLRIGHLDLGRRDVRPVAFHRSRGLAYQRLLVVEVLCRDHALLVQGSIPLQRDLGIEQRGLVFRQLPFSLGQGRLVGTRVDFHQQVALMHRLPFLEGDLHNLAVDPRLDRHGVERGHGAYRGQIAVEVAALHLRRRNRHSRAGRGRGLERTCYARHRAGSAKNIR